MELLKSRFVMGASRGTNLTTKVGACQNPAPGSAGPAEKYSAITAYNTFCVFGNLRNPMKLLERLIIQTHWSHTIRRTHLTAQRIASPKQLCS